MHHLKAVTTTIMLTFTELTSKSYMQRAVSNPMKLPSSVLTFFFGTDYDDPKEYQRVMRGGPMNTIIEDGSSGSIFEEMQRFWFMQSDEYDEYCKPFIPAVRAAGTQQLHLFENSSSNDKNNDKKEFRLNTIDDIMSQIILCDQLSRNCFRGQNEAYQYDSVAEKLALILIDDYYYKMDDDNNTDDQQKQECQDPNSANTASSSSSSPLKLLDGEYYAPYIAFMTLPLVHSESLMSHERALGVLNSAIPKFENLPASSNALKLTRSSLLEHKEIIDRFGRYPHRNSKYERETTPEEQAWLDDIENLPGWAKSQG